MTDYVSGANGFIGKHLMARLPDAIAIPHAQLATYQFQKPFRMFFLSTYGNMHDHDDKNEIFKANVFDLFHVLRQEPEWILYTSSSSVDLPVQTTYSMAKRTAEEALRTVPSCVVRLFSVTGVGEQPQHLIPTLIRSCMTGLAMELVPDATHDFVDVKDVVEVIGYLSRHEHTGLFEVGNGFAITNDEVRCMVEDVCGHKANVFMVHKVRDYDNAEWFSRNPVTMLKKRKTLRKSIEEMVAAYDGTSETSR
jgi:nucleoside-diphosphate-sugar epimerase